MKCFAEHRQALMRRLPDGLILLSGGIDLMRNRDTAYVFRQDSNFQYLSGVEESDCLLLLDPRRRKTVLFVPRIDNTHRVWLGYVPSPAEARTLFGVPKVQYSDELPKVLKAAKKGYRKAYADKPAIRRFGSALKGLSKASETLLDSLEELRAVKDAAEVAFIRKASDATCAAHRAAMAGALPGMREYEVQAIFEAECHKAGMRHLAFPTIAAAESNSAVLHYTKDDARLRPGDLFLLDSGAEYRGYAADVTRTFPVSATFTRRQRDVYSIVLEAHEACIQAARAGTTSIELQSLAIRKLTEGLKDIRLLRGDVDGLVETGAVRLFYPHGIGHLLGLDVHDGAGGRRRRIPNPKKVPIRFEARLEPGFVITIEPGLYFIEALLHDPENRRKHKGSVDFARAETFLGFGGVRIEDDVVVRPKGPPLDLTSVPKTIKDVEEVRRKALSRRPGRTR